MELNEVYYVRENHEKEQLLLANISEYYEQHHEYEALVRSIIAKKETLSAQKEKELLLLRKLDTMVCKKKVRGVHNRHASLPSHYNLCYFINGCIPINLLDSYYRELRHYQKRYFDGFRERQAKTSLCRLNYFKWVNEIQLWSKMADVQDVLKRVEETEKQQGAKGQQSKKRKREDRKDATTTPTPTPTAIYLFHCPQELVLPQKPIGCVRIVLNADVEERILHSCPMYETAQLFQFH